MNCRVCHLIRSSYFSAGAICRDPSTQRIYQHRESWLRLANSRVEYCRCESGRSRCHAVPVKGKSDLCMRQELEWLRLVGEWDGLGVRNWHGFLQRLQGNAGRREDKHSNMYWKIVSAKIPFTQTFSFEFASRLECCSGEHPQNSSF